MIWLSSSKNPLATNIDFPFEIFLLSSWSTKLKKKNKQQRQTNKKTAETQLKWTLFLIEEFPGGRGGKRENQTVN